MRSLYCCLAFLLFGAPTLAQTYPPRVRTFGANGPGPLTFEQVVRGGARRTLGMPSFEKDFSSDQARMIQAYVLDQAREVSSASKLAQGGH